MLEPEALENAQAGQQLGQDCANREDPVQDSHLVLAHRASLQFIAQVHRESQAHILARLPFRVPFR
jgi:hypothetical protein